MVKFDNFKLRQLQVLDAIFGLVCDNCDTIWADIEVSASVECARLQIDAEDYTITLIRDDTHYTLKLQAEWEREFVTSSVANKDELAEFFASIHTQVKQEMEDRVKEYWVFGTNKWSKSSYTFDEAELLSKTLINCSYCIDCEACHYCRRCTACVNLHFCDDCSGCVDCSFSEALEDCDSVHYSYAIKEADGDMYVCGDEELKEYK